jgi:hypothetical protein
VGTIKHALAQIDGTVVTLDCVHIKSIYSEPQSFLIIYDWYITGPTLIVDAPVIEDMKPGQVVDIIGTISSLPDGRRIIVCPTILGYMDGDAGNILVRGGPTTKGTFAPVEWPYKIQLY